jgi:hypothetical protein
MNRRQQRSGQIITLIGLDVSRSSPDCDSKNHPLLVVHRTPKTSDVERLLQKGELAETRVLRARGLVFKP